MKRIAPSIYTYDEGCKIFETTDRNEPTNSIPATGEKIIIQVLLKYGFLSIALLQRLFIMHNHSTINVKKSLRKMQQQGKAIKYTIEYPGDIADIDIYVLDERLREGKQKAAVFRYDMTDIPYILEHLSISQWHISMLEGKNTKEVAFFKQISAEGYITQIQSLVEFKSIIGKKMYLSAVTTPKGTHKQDLARLFTTLITMDRYFQARSSRFGAYLIAIICESEAQIEEVSRLLTEMAETSEMYVLYSLDMLSSEETFDPLSTLYEVTRTEGETSITPIQLR